MLSTFPGLVAIDRFGRRFVLLTGAIGMGVSQYIVAACGAATSIDNNSSVIAQFSFICIYIFFFASTWGPAAWVVTGEMFPLRARAKGLSMTTVSLLITARQVLRLLTINCLTGSKLVLQLDVGVHHPLPHRRAIREPRNQYLLDLGRFLLDRIRFCLLHDL